MSLHRSQFYNKLYKMLITLWFSYRKNKGQSCRPLKTLESLIGIWDKLQRALYSIHKSILFKNFKNNGSFNKLCDFTKNQKKNYVNFPTGKRKKSDKVFVPFPVTKVSPFFPPVSLGACHENKREKFIFEESFFKDHMIISFHTSSQM